MGQVEKFLDESFMFLHVSKYLFVYHEDNIRKYAHM